MASNSKKRRRVLRVSCILAALIIAGSSFAWFTSKDEVTNRLSSNADYDVKIVESYAPPKNWSPGQNINKDVYALNTGSVAAFVNEDVTSKLTYTVERYSNTFEADKDLTLTEDEVDAVKAGAYLAGAFATNGTKITGVQSGAIAEYFNNGKNTDPLTTTDFTPDTEGLYFFRRSITVEPGSTTANNHVAQSEEFTYDGYYFVPATTASGTSGDPGYVPAKPAKYYKVADIRSNEIQTYKAGDGSDDDGILTKLPAFKYVYEYTDTVTPKLKYDSTGNRLVATVNTGVGLASGDGAAVDSANSDLVGTETSGLLKDLNDAKTNLDKAKSDYAAAVGQKKAEIDTIAFYAGTEKAETIAAANTNITQVTNAMGYDDVNTYTPSNNSDIKAPGVLRGQIDEYNNLVPTYKAFETSIATADAAIGDGSTDGAQKTYNDAYAAVNTNGTQKAYDDAVDAYRTATGREYTDDVALITTPPAEGSAIYDVWTKDQANKAAKETLAAAAQNLADKQADKALLEANAASTKEKLIALSNTIYTNIAALNTAIGNRDTANTDAGSVDPDRIGGEQSAYETALNNYNDKLKAYNEARAKYEANDKDGREIKIYIKLSTDTVTTTNEKDKWQLTPIDIADDTAHFYYTGILQDGESSSKLIDSVELAPEVSQKAYKYFDFDLNINLDSAQIVYADDQKTILTTAVDGNATSFENKKAKLSSPQDLETAVLWS